MTQTFSVKEISSVTGFSKDKIYKIGKKLNLIRVKSLLKKNYYTVDQLMQIKEYGNRKDKIICYYPLKTTVTYYIYESKMNKL